MGYLEEGIVNWMFFVAKVKRKDYIRMCVIDYFGMFVPCDSAEIDFKSFEKMYETIDVWVNVGNRPIFKDKE